jgi:hypothetical protein
LRELYSTALAIISGLMIIGVTLIFALIQSQELIYQPEKPVWMGCSIISHPIEEYEQCAECHGLAGMAPYPLKHLGWNNRSCVECHLLGKAWIIE